MRTFLHWHVNGRTYTSLNIVLTSQRSHYLLVLATWPSIYKSFTWVSWKNSKLTSSSKAVYLTPVLALMNFVWLSKGRKVAPTVMRVIAHLQTSIVKHTDNIRNDAPTPSPLIPGRSTQYEASVPSWRGPWNNKPIQKSMVWKWVGSWSTNHAWGKRTSALQDKSKLRASVTDVFNIDVEGLNNCLDKNDPLDFLVNFVVHLTKPSFANCQNNASSRTT